MKKSRHMNPNVTTVLSVLAITLIMALVAGCTSNAVAPSTESSGQSTLTWLNSTDQADRIPVPFMLDRTVSALIGPKGGILQLNLNGYMPVVFRVPAGALDEPTLITISALVVKSPGGEFVVYDCGPDGTVFNLPLQLLQPEPPGVTIANLFYFNETTSKWELQETSRVIGSVALFHIYHFSKYGISR